MCKEDIGVVGDADQAAGQRCLRAGASARVISLCASRGQPWWQDDAEAVLKYQWSGGYLRAWRSDRGELMVKMTEEQKAQRMAARRRAEAEAEEARELRREAKRREWVEKSMYLTYDEMMAGMPCRGCGEILWDGKGKPFVPINNRTEEDQREIDEAEAKFQELHPDCHEGRWSMQASSTLHCHLCCPSSPMSPTQREKIRNLFSVTVSPRSLNRWELTLTCDHVVETTANKDSTNPFGYTWRCDQCGRPRGIISRRMLGPTEVPEEPGPKSLTATEQRRRETLRRNLAKVQAELASLEAKAAAAEAKEGGHAPRSVPTPR